MSRLCAVLIGLGGLYTLGVMFNSQHTAAMQAKHIAQVPTIYSLNELQSMTAQHPQLIVELTANWCIACKVVERDLFINQPAPELSSWTRVKLDISETTTNSQAVLKHFNLFGPHAILMFKHGQLVNQLLGEPTRSEFKQALQRQQ